jgi:hypothetical protein
LVFQTHHQAVVGVVAVLGDVVLVYSSLMRVIEDRFRQRLNEIDSTVNLPETLLGVFDTHLGAIEKFDLKPLDRQTLANIKKSVANIDKRSLRDNFSHIYNQACVLACSSLEASLRDVFDCYFFDPSDLAKIKPDKAQGIKVSLYDLIQSYFPAQDDRDEDSWYLGKMLRERDSGLNFQNYGSIKRNFAEYCAHDIALSSDIENSIAFYLECRHSIVHSSGLADKRFLNMLGKIGGGFGDRFGHNTQIELTTDDWVAIKEGFTHLVEDVNKDVVWWSVEIK